MIHPKILMFKFFRFVYLQYLLVYCFFIFRSSWCILDFFFCFQTRKQEPLGKIFSLQLCDICKKYKGLCRAKDCSASEKLSLNKISLPFGKATTENSFVKILFCWLFCCSNSVFCCVLQTRNNIFGIRLQLLILRVCLCERKIANLVHLFLGQGDYFF